MLALHEDLENFAQTIISGQALPPLTQAVCPHYPVATAIAIYSNNYHCNLQDTLVYAYPVVEQLVGNEFFRYMAKQFIKRYPSKSGNLHHYGEEMASFIAFFEPVQNLPYLSDIAALEWCCHCAYFAEDRPVLDISKLAELPEAHYADLVLLTHPALHVMHSRYPIAAIWHAHQNGSVDDLQIEWDSTGLYTIQISRQNNIIVVNEFTQAEGVWLKNIQTGMQLGKATDSILGCHPDFNLELALSKFVAQGVISDFILKEHS